MEAQVQALINAANDARHCLCAVEDLNLRGTIENTVTNLEAAIAAVTKHYAPLPTPSLPAMDWVKALPRPTSSKDAFIDERDRENTGLDGRPY